MHRIYKFSENMYFHFKMEINKNKEHIKYTRSTQIKEQIL